MNLRQLQQLKVSGILRHTLRGIKALPGQKVNGLELAVDMDTWGTHKYSCYATCLAGYTILSMIDLEAVTEGTEKECWHRNELGRSGIPSGVIDRLEGAIDSFSRADYVEALDRLQDCGLIDRFEGKASLKVIHKFEDLMRWDTARDRQKAIPILAKMVRKLEKKRL